MKHAAGSSCSFFIISFRQWLYLRSVYLSYSYTFVQNVECYERQTLCMLTLCFYVAHYEVPKVAMIRLVNAVVRQNGYYGSRFVFW